MDPETRDGHEARILAGISSAIADVRGLTISGYWPVQGEPDLREYLKALPARGGRAALPAVVRPHHPLVFRAWRPGEPLTPDAQNLPAPPASAEELKPDVLLVPLVGFDPAGYRLGYGGGYFDRTIAAFSTRPRVIGVGYDQARIPSVRPQPHDRRMDLVVTESGIHVSPPPHHPIP